MSLDAFLEIGMHKVLGSYLFSADEIKRFAASFDPQPFHLDEEAARRSVLGGLCASGWHTAAVWMRLNLASMQDAPQWNGPGAPPAFGPSPGFRNMRWPKPVFAGETVSYRRTALGYRPLASRPGWFMLSFRAGGEDSQGGTVLEFDGAVLVKAAR